MFSSTTEIFFDCSFLSFDTVIPAGPTEEDKADDFLGGKNWCRKCSLGWFVLGRQVNLVRFLDAFQIQKILQQSMLHSEKLDCVKFPFMGEYLDNFLKKHLELYFQGTSMPINVGKGISWMHFQETLGSHFPGNLMHICSNISRGSDVNMFKVQSIYDLSSSSGKEGKQALTYLRRRFVKIQISFFSKLSSETQVLAYFLRWPIPNTRIHQKHSIVASAQG